MSNTGVPTFIGNGKTFGSGDSIECGTWDPSATTISLSAWINWNGDTTSKHTIIAKRVSSSPTGMRYKLDYATDVTPKTLTFYDGATRETFGLAAMTTVAPKNTWHYVVLTSTSGLAKGTKLYVDGQKAPIDTTSTWGKCFHRPHPDRQR